MKGAIFDMDGTLLDSMGVWDHCGEQFLARRGLAAPPGLRDALKELSMVQTAAYLKKRFELPDTEQAIIDEINGTVEHAYRFEVPAKADILPLLQTLESAGIPRCVATATDRPLVEAALERTGLLHYFPFILTCTEVGAGKDQPLIFEEAARRLGTPKGETVVFEDALYAVRTAKAAGFSVVAIWDASSAGDEAQIRMLADQYLKTYAEWEGIEL